MKNKTKAVLLTLLLVWGLTGCNVQNKEESPSGLSSVPDTSVEESIAESPASDFSFHEIDGRGIVYYHGDDEHVVIPAQIDGKPVTEIGRQAFYRYDKLVSVTIPSSVTAIENEAFNYCTNLKTVRLTSGLQKIGSNAFKNCISLSEITLPDTLTTIGDSAFSCCYDLKQVHIPASVDNWWGGAFYMSGLESVTFEEGLTYIGYGSFAVTKLKEVVLPSSIESIEFNAFNGCDDLENIVLNQGLQKIDSGAFGHCSKIEEIVIPASVSEMNESAFTNCENLEYVIFEGDAPASFTDPNSLSLGSYYVCHYEDAKGFSSPYWNHYKTAVISKDHKTVTKPEITYSGDYEYVEHDGEIEIIKYFGSSKKVTVPSEIDGKPVTAIGYGAFALNAVLEKLHIPSSVKLIDGYAFAYCDLLSDVTLSNGLQTIGREAFCLCDGIKSIALPQTLTELGDDAFSNCRGLTEITIPAGIETWGSGAFAFTSIASVTLREGLASIGEAAFYGTQLTELVLPSTIKTIKERAFYHCPLQSVVLNEGLETVGYNAFASNFSLTEIVIPSTVKHITEGAFENCRDLESVRFEGDAPSAYLEDPEEMLGKVNYTVYYHEGAKGFTSPLWNDFLTEIW